MVLKRLHIYFTTTDILPNVFVYEKLSCQDAMIIFYNTINYHMCCIHISNIRVTHVLCVFFTSTPFAVNLTL